MSTTDILYLSMLLGSIPLGHLVKISGSPARKQFLCTAAGICLGMALVGVWGILHSFVTILGTYLIVVSLGPRRCEWVAFLYVFGYLFFFRTCTYFGFEKPPAHSNAIQLLVTLRCCTFPFEIFDPEVTGETDSKKSKRPSFYEFLSYSYCYCGLTTGPYYRYKTFKDMINQEHPKQISTFIPAIRNLKTVPFFGAIYLLLNHYFQ
ncbi:Lysophospholipid acyltransferase 7 [Desmophyllum pertusum]|uniref:Lysophospholipid acyltransferase 7 n=1 Tax=Desmophyllum pertusum TaxID=174260 RepID=A0A9X0CIX9_9CNID|nr:Lysophospholipid acyltransferase 7 [Desmophyllum pertusum]